MSIISFFVPISPKQILSMADNTDSANLAFREYYGCVQTSRAPIP